MATPTLLQHNNAGAGQSGASFSLAFNSNTKKGSMLFAALRTNTSINLTSITDSQGNTWVAIGPLINTVNVYFGYALNTAGGTADNVTFNFASSVGGISPVIEEWSNVGTIRAHDAGAIGTSATAQSQTITPVKGDLLLGVFGSQNGSASGSTSGGNGFNIDDSSIFAGGIFCAIESQIAPNNSAIASNFALASSSIVWASFIAAFTPPLSTQSQLDYGFDFDF